MPCYFQHSISGLHNYVRCYKSKFIQKCAELVPRCTTRTRSRTHCARGQQIRHALGIASSQGEDCHFSQKKGKPLTRTRLFQLVLCVSILIELKLSAENSSFSLLYRIFNSTSCPRSPITTLKSRSCTCCAR